MILPEISGCMSVCCTVFSSVKHLKWNIQLVVCLHTARDWISTAFWERLSLLCCLNGVWLSAMLNDVGGFLCDALLLVAGKVLLFLIDILFSIDAVWSRIKVQLIISYIKMHNPTHNIIIPPFLLLQLNIFGTILVNLFTWKLFMLPSVSKDRRS